MQQTGEQRSAAAVWREERPARWFFAAHLQSALGTGAGYVALLLLAYVDSWGFGAAIVIGGALAASLGGRATFAVAGAGTLITLAAAARAVQRAGTRPPTPRPALVPLDLRS